MKKSRIIRKGQRNNSVIRIIKNRPQSGYQSGYFGDFGGQFVPETLYIPLKELEESFASCIKSKEFNRELDLLLANYAGRPSPLYFAEKLSKYYERKIYLKRA